MNVGRNRTAQEAAFLRNYSEQPESTLDIGVQINKSETLANMVRITN